MIGFLQNYLRGQTIPQLRKKGAVIGENTELLNCTVDKYTAFLVEIGDNCLITNATILAHDASMKKHIGYTRIQKTTIGNNVFIGLGAIVLAGSHIGNNVIVGAGAVVRGDIPDDSIVIGNPGQIIGKTSDFITKNHSMREKSLVVDKMCSEMKLEELLELRNKLGNDTGYEL